MVRQALVLLSLLLTAAQEGTVGLVPIIIGGNERLGWDQAADDDVQIATFRYIAYVDGNAVGIVGGFLCPVIAACTPASAPLPPLSIGFHTVDIAATVNGSRSKAVGRTACCFSSCAPSRSDRNGRRARHRVHDSHQRWRSFVGHADRDRTRRPVDLAFMPDGGLIVAERGGLLPRGPQWPIDVAPAWPVFEPRSAGSGSFRAVDADFARTHLVRDLHDNVRAEHAGIFLGEISRLPTASPIGACARRCGGVAGGRLCGVAVRTGRQALCRIRRRRKSASRLRLVVLQRKGPAIERGWLDP